MEIISTPIICTNCKKLALAYYEGVPLCPQCLTASVGRSTDPFAVGRIRPLASTTPELKGLIHCKRNSSYSKNGDKQRVAETTPAQL